MQVVELGILTLTVAVAVLPLVQQGEQYQLHFFTLEVVVELHQQVEQVEAVPWLL
ncbi:hypothetical protein D3C72_2067780 [compost metagenome]